MCKVNPQKKTFSLHIAQGWVVLGFFASRKVDFALRALGFGGGGGWGLATSCKDCEGVMESDSIASAKHRFEILNKMSELNICTSTHSQESKIVDGKLKQMMQLTAAISAMLATGKEDFQTRYPEVDKGDLEAWMKEEPFKSINTRSIKAVKLEKTRCTNLIEKTVQDANSALAPLAKGVEGGSWKQSLATDCAFTEVVKRAKPLIRGPSVTALTNAFNQSNKERWQCGY